jgi:mRNA-degrading endonuclease toxin of MazEF toxin-antitoxin module
LDTRDDDFVLAPITSQKRIAQGDYQLVSWKAANLLKPSWIRLAKISCIRKNNIKRKIGQLSSEDISMVKTVWSRLYSLEINYRDY